MEHEHQSATTHSHSDHSMEDPLEKETGGVAAGTPQHLENIRTVSKVPGNPNYYEKDGLRTYGDDEDHDHEPPVCRGANYACGSHMLTSASR